MMFLLKTLKANGIEDGPFFPALNILTDFCHLKFKQVCEINSNEFLFRTKKMFQKEIKRGFEFFDQPPASLYGEIRIARHVPSASASCG